MQNCLPDAFAGYGYACTPQGSGTFPGDPLTWSVQPSGTCTWLTQDSDGRLHGKPSAGDVGPCSITITMRDDHGGSVDQPLAFEVKPWLGHIENGYESSCYTAPTGAVRCWGTGYGLSGYNDTLSVGDGAPGRTIIETGDLPIGGLVLETAASNLSRCALLRGGTVQCWGLNDLGKLGYAHNNDIGDGGIGGSIITNGDLPIGGTATQIAVSRYGVCALLDTGGVRCWGGIHGYSSATKDYLTAAEAAALGDVPIGLGPIKQIAAGHDHYCALGFDGRVRCWGNGYGLGYNDGVDVALTINARTIIEAGDLPIGGEVAQIDAGVRSSCAVLTGGALRCWGRNSYGSLGYNDALDTADGTPGRSIIEMGDVPVGGRVIQVAIGDQHTCAVLEDRNVRCWGMGTQGALGYDDALDVGDGTPGRSILDMGDVPLGGRALLVDTVEWDSAHTCALLDSGRVRCWGLTAGYDKWAEIGNGGPGGSILDNGDVPIF